MNKQYDYKVYIPVKQGEVEPGVYDVVSDNESYDTPVSAVDIIINGKSHVIQVSKYYWGNNPDSAQLVWQNFDVKNLDMSAITEDQAKENLNGLHHSDYTVDEFITEFGGGYAKMALIVAIRNDWDAMPLTKQRMDRIFIDAMKNR